MDWLLWVDIETTGLDPNEDKILQLACVLTNCQDEKIHYKQEFTFYHDEGTLLKMSEWCKEQHFKSGLVYDVLQSSWTIEDVERKIILILNQHLTIRDTVYLAGNSVHFDKSFISRLMPLLAKRCSHRIVDVSSLAIICKHLAPNLYENRPDKSHEHTAMADIMESIAEYTYYKATFLKTE